MLHMAPSGESLWKKCILSSC